MQQANSIVKDDGERNENMRGEGGEAPPKRQAQSAQRT
jgi:hypothetical protein